MRLTFVAVTVLACAVAGASSDVVPSAAVNLQYGVQNGKPSYSVHVQAQAGHSHLTLQSADTFLFAFGEKTWPSAATAPTVTNGTDALGPYSKISWQLNFSVELVVSARLYPNTPDTVVFEQEWPNGAPNITAFNAGSISSSFPSFAVPPQLFNNEHDLGYAHFAGYMGGDSPQYGPFVQGMATSLEGGITSGALCIFRRPQDAAFVISPLNQFMVASWAVGENQTQVGWGIEGAAAVIPPGFKVSFLLVAASGGVNKAVQRWGTVIRSYYGKVDREANHERDFTLQYMGYVTDNGAYYYYWTDTHRDYQNLLLEVQQYAFFNGIPYQYVQIDSWWYYRQNGTDTQGVPLSGVINWTAPPNIFPNGTQFLFNATGWPIQAHNRYWGTDNVYASNPLLPIGPSEYNGEVFPFAWGEEQAGLPVSDAFWEYFFSINSDWGLTVYEQDWLSLTQDAMPQLVENVTFGAQWLRAMGHAAAHHNLSIQYCMSYPRHVFMSLELPAVTQARASNDYQPESIHKDTDQWQIGESSLWLSAIGVAPSKDGYWSMSTPQPAPHYSTTSLVYESRNRLESLIQSLANGPVQVGDRIGYSDADLITRCCNAEGLILRPDIAASTIDACFASRAFGGGVSSCPVGAEVQTTYSALSGRMPGATQDTTAYYTYLLSVNNAEGASFTVDDLPFAARRMTGEMSAQWIYFEDNTTASFGVMNRTHPVPLAASDVWSFQYLTLVPVPSHMLNSSSAGSSSSGTRSWLLQRESGTWIGASGQRFGSMTFHSDGGFDVVVEGVPSEFVELEFVSWPELTQQVVGCYLGPTGTGVIGITSSGEGKCVF